MTADGICWPSHIYVPGRNARHEEDFFDPIKASAVAGMTADALAASAAMRHGRAYLQQGYYWEAHEVLEAVWLACAPNSAERVLVQAMIQLANAALKQKMGREGAAQRLFAEARRLERECRISGRAEVMGIELDAFGRQIDAMERGVSSG